QLQRLYPVLQREAMRDEICKIHLSAEHKLDRFILQVNRRTVGSQKRLLIDTNGSRINRHFAARRLREQHRTAAESGGIDRRPDQRIAANCQNDGVGASALSKLPNAADNIIAACVNRSAGSVSFRYCKPLFIQIGSNHLGTCPAGQYAQNDANRALPDYKYCLTRTNLKRLDCFQTSIHRLNECPQLK